MSLTEDIQRDLVAAMKAKAETELSVLRMLRAAIKNKEIDKHDALTDDEIVALVKTTVKQQRDAMSEFRAGGRADLVAKAESEIRILEKYLPLQMDEAAVRAVVEAKIKTAGATAKDFGRVMGEVMKDLKGKADGVLVGKILKETLK